MPRLSSPPRATGMLAVLGTLVAAGCHSSAARPAAAGAGAGAGAVPVSSAPSAVVRGEAADARFMRGMIGHHGQALTMAALVPARTTRPELRLLAERITASQQDEIGLMRRWLERRGHAAPTTAGSAAGDAHAHHGTADAAAGAHAADHAAMPGMLTAAELARLGAATGPAFERLFLELMIRHHEGALAMVAELLATPGAGQDSETFRLASDVDADQRAEVRRMRALLAATGPGK